MGLAIATSNGLGPPRQPNTQRGKGKMRERGVLRYQAPHPSQAT